MHELLEPECITFVGSASTQVERGVVLLDAREERIEADRIVSLPLLEGPRTPGLPSDDDGFVPVDAYGRVPGAPDVDAAGDATASRIKQGGLACQQADVVAEQIAAVAGAPIQPGRYRPVLRGKLMTGGLDRYLRAGAGDDGAAVSDLPLWWPPAKVAGRYLSSFLAHSHPLETGSARAAPHIRIELPLDDLA